MKFKKIDWNEVWAETKKHGNIEDGELWAFYVVLGFVVFFLILQLPVL